MTVYDYYEIQLLVNKEEVDLSPESFSFTMYDSIHELFPTLRFDFHDTTGLMQEYLFTVEGLKAQLLYGADNQTIRNNYVIISDELLEPKTQGLLNGDVSVYMKHAFYDQQFVQSAAFEDRISNIVRKIAAKHSFDGVVINDTGNEDVWYQPLVTDARFIRTMLLPYAYSRNAEGTPFFCFITSDNVFNFRNYASMIGEKPVATLVYESPGEQSSRNPNLIRDIERARTGSDYTRHLRRRVVTRIDSSNGSVVEENDVITDAPSSGLKQVPIIDAESDPTGALHLGYTGSDSGEEEHRLGYQAHSRRDSFFLDRFRVSIPLNIALMSGKTVELDLTKWVSDDGGESSLTFRGNYLIEEASHIWDGGKKEGRSEMILSRKGMRVPNSYVLKNQLMQS